MEYVIKLDQGEYWQSRGGCDWGRSSKSGATVFDSKEEAQEVIDSNNLATFRAKIVNAW